MRIFISGEPDKIARQRLGQLPNTLSYIFLFASLKLKKYECKLINTTELNFQYFLNLCAFNQKVQRDFFAGSI